MQVFEGDVSKSNFYRHLEEDYDGTEFWAMNSDVVFFYADDTSKLSRVLNYWDYILCYLRMNFPEQCSSIKSEKWYFFYKGHKYFHLFDSNDFEWLLSRAIIKSLEDAGCKYVFYQMGVYD